MNSEVLASSAALNTNFDDSIPDDTQRFTPERIRQRFALNGSSRNIAPLVQKMAIATILVALLPIGIGSVVTTLKAGMAFADWPTSDGENMLLYNFFKDLRHTDRLVEHTHRLAGMLIGVFTIAMVAVTFWKEKTGWVRKWSLAILVAVIVQGLLGGLRVIQNAQAMAMVHSITGGLFFAMCFVFAHSVSRPGQLARQQESAKDSRVSPILFYVALILPVLVVGQYFLGGMFRHLGTMLHEHVIGAIVVFLAAVYVIIGLWRSDSVRLRNRMKWLGAALVLQISLGLGAWATKLGIPYIGYVASVNSLLQSVICSLHTIGGMFLLATSATVAVELWLLAEDGYLAKIHARQSASLLPTNVQRPEGSLS